MANRDRDEDTGRFVEKYSEADFLGALEASDGAASTREVADIVGCPQRTAYHRLDELRDAGRVRGRKVGGAMLWMLANSED